MGRPGSVTAVAYLDELLRLDVYSGSTLTPYYIHSDAIGSTTAITDGGGNLVERVSYDTFGMPAFTDADGNKLTQSAIGNTTLFQGREYDPELNLYHYRARAYDPIMGRFLQTDPMGYRDSMNLYQAMNTNPWNYLDPFGLFEGGSWDPAPGRKPGLHNVDGKEFRKVVIGTLGATLIPVDFTYEKALDALDWIVMQSGISKTEGEFREFADFALKVLPFLKPVSAARGAGYLKNHVSKVVGRLKGTANDSTLKATAHLFNGISRVKEGLNDRVIKSSFYKSFTAQNNILRKGFKPSSNDLFENNVIEAIKGVIKFGNPTTLTDTPRSIPELIGGIMVLSEEAIKSLISIVKEIF